MDDFSATYREYGDRATAFASVFARKIWSAGSDFADEVKQRALVALWEASCRYDPARCDDFWVYASSIIRGRIRDFMRETDPLSRRARQIVDDEGDEAIVPWCLRMRENVGDHEHHLAADADPESSLVLSESEARVRALLGLLDGRGAEVVRRVVLGGEGYRTVAADLGVSASRVSQICGDALATLRRLACSCGEPRRGAECPACGSRGPRERIPFLSAGDLLEHEGRRLTVGEWSREVGVPAQTIRRRLLRGQAPREALERRSRGSSVLLTFGGETASIKEWARRRGINTNTLWARLRAGWDPERALGELTKRGGSSCLRREP